MCSGYGITFDSAGWWGFDNDTFRNVINFGVDNSSSSYSDNSKNNFLILGEGQTFGINGSFGWPEKNLLLILLIKNAAFSLSLYFKADNSYLFVNRNIYI